MTRCVFAADEPSFRDGFSDNLTNRAYHDVRPVELDVVRRVGDKSRVARAATTSLRRRTAPTMLATTGRPARESGPSHEATRHLSRDQR
jgi:hypothetical protein